MQLNDIQLDIVRNHTINEYPKEAVIAITKDNAIPLKNIHENPNDHFKVDRKTYPKETIALIHSHTYDVKTFYPGRFVDIRTPSKHDMQTQQALNIPFGIVGCSDNDVSDVLWFPDLDSPIGGQRYISGVHDCYSLICKYYYQNFNIKLDSHPRGYNWMDEEPDVYGLGYIQANCHAIDEDELLVGDIIIFNIRGHTCHAGLYMGNNKIAHHLEHRLSITDESFTKWRSKMALFLRHNERKI